MLGRRRGGESARVTRGRGGRGPVIGSLTALIVAATLAASASAAGYRTANFVIEAPTERLARLIGDAAEQYRHTLAVEWTGRPLPRWSRPFVFDRGEVFNWTMTIQGSEERILDSVLPHEITHTIFASHFRQPLPRWADEGACTTVEHPVERARQHKMLIEFLTTGRGIAFPEMFAMREYPADVLPLYSQGYSLARYLIERGGRHKYVSFVGDGLAGDDWAGALERHYGVDDLATLQHVWLAWVKQGCPAPPVSLAAATPPAAETWTPTARGQSPDPRPATRGPTPSRPVSTSAARTSIYARAGAVRR
jgi:hypothetical protein